MALKKKKKVAHEKSDSVNTVLTISTCALTTCTYIVFLF